MPFSVPGELIAYEYFSAGEKRRTQAEEEYADYIEMAFFVVHLGFTKDQYWDLTPVEKAFILKAYEDRIVAETTHIRDAVFNAKINADRKRGKPFRKLWQRRAKVDHDVIRTQYRTILDIEKKEKEKIAKNGGLSWIEKIYKAAGRKMPAKKEKK